MNPLAISLIYYLYTALRLFYHSFILQAYKSIKSLYIVTCLQEMATPPNPEKLVEEGFGTATDQKELSPSLATLPAEKDQSSEPTRDPFLVTWDGPDDPDNPKNWAKKRKWAATFVSLHSKPSTSNFSH